MHKSSGKLLQFFALSLLCGATAAAYTVVNIEAKSAFAPAYSGQGAYADSDPVTHLENNYWNTFTSTAGGSNLTASDGVTVTTISFSVSGAQIAYGTTPDFAANLLADYYYVIGTTPATFTIGGLTAGHTYDIYFYSQAGASGTTDRAATFTLDGSSKNLTAFLEDSFEEGTNYVVFRATSIGGTFLSGSFVGSLGGNEAELNGLQIVDLGAIPEPSTYAALLGLAGLALALRRRHRIGR